MTHTTHDDANRRSRGWICTLNNYNEVEYAKVVSFASDCCQYACIGKEVGKTGTPHLQIYFQMKTSYSGQTLKNKTSTRMWVGIANAPAKSREYCMKDGDFLEVGEFKDTLVAKAKGQARGGESTKKMWEELNTQVSNGVDANGIRNAFPHLYYRYAPGIHKGIGIANAVKPRTSKTCVHVLVGPPGVGKTTAAMALTHNNGYFQNSQNGMWWDNYDGKQPAVLDDFHGNMKFDYWKRLTDAYPMQVEVKGGMMNFNSKLIVITSNQHPESWWSAEVLGTHGLAALFRRINRLQIWDEEKECFGDYQWLEGGGPVRQLWKDGCICHSTVQEESLIPDLSQDSLMEQMEESSFLDQPLHTTSTTSSKKRTLSSLVPKPAKKQKPVLVDSSDLDSDDISDESDDSSFF